MQEVEFEAKQEAERQIPKRRKQLVDALKQATPVDTGEARAGWYDNKKGISNDVEHIDNLNAGSSQQAPSYFIEKTLLLHKDVHPSGIIVKRK